MLLSFMSPSFYRPYHTSVIGIKNRMKGPQMPPVYAIMTCGLRTTMTMAITGRVNIIDQIPFTLLL